MIFRVNFTYYSKLEVINHHLLGKQEFVAKAKRYGVKFTHVRKWVHAYEAHGHKGFIKTYNHHSGVFKFTVLKMMEQNQLSINQAAAPLISPLPALSSYGTPLQ